VLDEAGLRTSLAALAGPYLYVCDVLVAALPRPSDGANEVELAKKVADWENARSACGLGAVRRDNLENVTARIRRRAVVSRRAWPSASAPR
jgi:hypothetical protein